MGAGAGGGCRGRFTSIHWHRWRRWRRRNKVGLLVLLLLLLGLLVLLLLLLLLLVLLLLLLQQPLKAWRDRDEGEQHVDGDAEP